MPYLITPTGTRKCACVLIAILFIGLLASCNEATEIVPIPTTLSPTLTPSLTTFPSPTTPPTVETIQETEPRVLIEYQRSGGFVGYQDILTITSDGKAILIQNNAQHQFTIDQNTTNQLIAKFDQAGFSTLIKEYLPADTCCDLIEFIITYKDHTIRTMDTAIPETLQPVLDALNEIIETKGSL